MSDDSKAVATTMKNVGALPHVLSATDPLMAKGTPAVSKNGKIAYGSVSWDVAPALLGADYLDSLDDAVEPARKAGLVVEYGGGAGQIGQAPDDALPRSRPGRSPTRSPSSAAWSGCGPRSSRANGTRATATYARSPSTSARCGSYRWIPA